MRPAWVAGEANTEDCFASVSRGAAVPRAALTERRPVRTGGPGSRKRRAEQPEERRRPACSVMRRSLVACIPPLLLITCLVMLPGLEDKKNPSVKGRKQAGT